MHDSDHAHPRASRTAEILDAAVARINQESAETRLTPTRVRNGVALEATANQEVSPPVGYSFVQHDGQMSTRLLKTGHSKQTEHEPMGPTWLNASSSLDMLISQANDVGRDWSFGWIWTSEQGRTPELERALQRTTARIVGGAGRLVRAKLPADQSELQTILALAEVEGVGAIPPSVKLQSVVPSRSSHEPIPVFITLMTDDPDGRWRRALESFGAVVGYFDPAIRVYTANVTENDLEAIAAADFVVSIESISVVKAAHDTAVPSMGADAFRIYQASQQPFWGVGGASVPIAVMDSGLNLNHLDISSNRKSICGANFVYYEPVIDDEDLWVDAGLHGTHVTGTIVGNGAVKRRFSGMAPLVEHIRFAKVLSHQGFGNSIFILRAMDFLARSSACPESGWSTERAKPLIVNMSLSASALVWEGRTVSERKLDSIVWDQRQLYVVAQANSAIYGLSNYASAKNSLAVGASLDSGELANFSSLGPTADGRLAPQVVGTGVKVTSTAGDGSRGGYREFNGTSMASPAVAGVAVLLMDAVPAHREHPALVRARLMASAIKPGVWFESPDIYPTNNSNGPGELQSQYGLGRVSARTSILNRDDAHSWTSGSVVSDLADGEYAFHDIQVTEGTSRLDLVLTWDEPPADAVASAVLNDLDLWLDHNGDCELEPCGEYSSQSSVDNVEWINVRNPDPGTYRVKVAASRVYTAPPRAALAWTMVRGSPTPNLEVTVDKEQFDFEKRDDSAQLSVTITANEYIATGTRLQIDCRRVDGSLCSSSRHFGDGELRISTTREDGVVQELRPAKVGESLEVGEIAVGEPWNGEISFRFGVLAKEDVNAFRLYLKASSWNANPASVSVLARLAGTDESVSEATVPTNDRFASASSLSGKEGSVALDLINAHTEPGEPLFMDRTRGRPSGSVWYDWTAPFDDLVSFTVTPDAAYGSTGQIGVDVFLGDRITELETVAASEWGVQFFAKSAEKYSIRVSHAEMSVPLTLNWSSGARPSNDNFIAAAVIDAADEAVSGTNSGATLEPGEFFGDLASTVWYRWTAPNDGAWRFKSSANNLRVLAFAGDDLTGVRLVSGFAKNVATIQARGNEVYHIVVATKDAESTGQTFLLTWESVNRTESNDDFAFAEEIPGEATATFEVNIDTDAGVEPNEPIESGVRTKWWHWTAPSNARYTWQLEDLVSTQSEPGSRLFVSVFTGDVLEDLDLIATNGTEMSSEFAFLAENDREYWVSVGVPTDDQWTFTGDFWRNPRVTLVWGPSPENDSLNHATLISGASGSVTGSSTFATSASGERRGVLGRSTLWWTYEATSTAWIRFNAEGEGGPWALVVHEESVDGTGTFDVLTSDNWQNNESEVLFEAQAGTRYRISLGVRGEGEGGEFTMRWEEAEDPGWLRDAGRVVNGDIDSNGHKLEIRRPGDLAINDEGDSLYLTSAIGLQVFVRDELTGGLDHVQLIEIDSDLATAALLWDPHRSRLLASACGTWWSFARNTDTHALDDVVEFSVTDDPGGCAQHREQVLMGASGSDIYRIRRSRIDHFVVDDMHEFRFVNSVSQGGVVRTVLSKDERYLYIATSNELRVYERNVETGELIETDFREAISAPYTPPLPLAITDDNAYLFVFDNDGERANLFSLTDPHAPVALASFSDYIDPFQLNRCRFADARNESSTVDVFCPGMAFVLRWDAEDQELKQLGRIVEGESDFLNNLIQNFGAPSYEAPTGFAVSKDDRYVYLSTPNHGIVIFGRDSLPRK